jgi:hypothetical protein
MKHQFAIALLLALLGSAAWAFLPFGYASTWDVNEADIFGPSNTDHEAPNLVLLGSQLSTGFDQPSIRSNEVQTEPVSNGRAFELQIGDAGAFFWNNQNNSIWYLQNGTGVSPPIAVQSDIYGNVGPLIHNPINNRLELEDFFNVIPVDGTFSVSQAASMGFTEIASVVYSYTTDGTAGGDTFFTLSVDDGVSFCTVNLNCSSGSTTTAFLANFTGDCVFAGFNQLSISFVNTGNCAAVPVVREFQIHHTLPNGP